MICPLLSSSCFTASFQKFNLEKWAQPLAFLNFQGRFEVHTSNGSGIWDPQFEILRIETMRTDRKPFYMV